MEADARRQRQQFYRDYVSGQWSMTELCERYQVSRPTSYKGVGRIERDGLKAVVDYDTALGRIDLKTGTITGDGKV